MRAERDREVDLPRFSWMWLWAAAEGGLIVGNWVQANGAKYAALGAFVLFALLEERSARRCRHLRVRCIHGDEINDRGGRRRACLDCGRALVGPLPDICSVTGEPHGAARLP